MKRSIALGTAALLAFLFLGKHPVSPWDEARTGVNAIEMLRNGDWANLHYAGQPDTWRAKPPFVVWCVAASFSIFGKNEWALRLPSALAITGAFFFIFQIITLFRSANFAMWTCLLLASGNGLIGWHVGRSGDFDAMLTCWLMAGVYFFLRWYLPSGRGAGHLLLSGLCFGLAFLAKGPAAGVLLPGLALFLFFEKKLGHVLRQPATWATAVVALAFPVGWWLVQHFHGIRYDRAVAGDTAFERLFGYDLWVRFTQASDGWKPALDPSFLFYSLDKSFNLWHLVFFGLLLFGLFCLAKNWRRSVVVLRSEKNRLLVLSLCLYFPLAVFLILAAKSNRWYLAPVLPFVGIATMWGIDFFWRKKEWVRYLFLGLLAFTLGRQVHGFLTPKPKPTFILEYATTLAEAEVVWQSGHIEQDVLLYLYFLNGNLKFGEPAALGEGEVWVKTTAGGYELRPK